MVREVASIWTMARRATTDEFVFNCLKIGASKAAQAILDSGVMLRPKKTKIVKAKPKKTQSKKIKSVKEDHLQFFLTEFDGNDENGSVDSGGNIESDASGGDSDDDEDDEGMSFLLFDDAEFCVTL